jgi:hypothetical protein
MSNKRISELTSLTAPATGDLLPIVDVSDTTEAGSGTTKRLTIGNLLTGLLSLVKLVYTEPDEADVQFTVADQTADDTDGIALTLLGAAGKGTGAGGYIEITAGGPVGHLYQGGDLYLAPAKLTGKPDYTKLRGAYGIDGDGGDVHLEAADGNGTDHDGGNVILRPGSTSSGSGNYGKIKLYEPSNSINAVIDTSLLASSDKTFSFPNQTGVLALISDIPTVPTPGGSSRDIQANDGAGGLAGGGLQQDASLMPAATIVKLPSVSSGNGSRLVIQAGDTTDAGVTQGGDIRLKAGKTSGSGGDGSVRIVDPSSTFGAAQFVTSSLTFLRSFIFPDQSGTFAVVVAAPTTASDPGVAGTIAYDATHIYVCVATDTWKRVAIATW